MDARTGDLREVHRSAFFSILLTRLAELDCVAEYFGCLREMAECNIVSFFAHGTLLPKPEIPYGLVKLKSEYGAACCQAVTLMHHSDHDCHFSKTVICVTAQLSRKMAKLAISSFETDFFDWFKALRQLEMRPTMTDLAGPLLSAHATNRKAWLGLREVLGFTRILKSLDYTCMYPRCPNPQPVGGAWVCFSRDTGDGCSYYCSIWCQQG